MCSTSRRRRQSFTLLSTHVYRKLSDSKCAPVGVAAVNLKVGGARGGFLILIRSSGLWREERGPLI